eukprot:9537327-Lingulodinium_polyedra.AAC.1
MKDPAVMNRYLATPISMLAGARAAQLAYGVKRQAPGADRGLPSTFLQYPAQSTLGPPPLLAPPPIPD